MARKIKQVDYTDVPQTLKDHPFFGMKLDNEQMVFRDMIWNKDVDVVFVNARAGSGKTLIAVATSVLLYKYGIYDGGIHYVMSAHAEGRQGFLPGDSYNKNMPYMSGLWSALETIGEFPEKVIKGVTLEAEKTGDAYITAETSTYLRGSNIGGSSKKILIVDEAQNFTVPDLRKTLTRACEGTKVIVIGHDLQCDIDWMRSGFTKCMRHFASKNNQRFAFCELTQCHRGLVAQTADEDWDLPEEE